MRQELINRNFDSLINTAEPFFIVGRRIYMNIVTFIKKNRKLITTNQFKLNLQTSKIL